MEVEEKLASVDGRGGARKVVKYISLNSSAAKKA